MNKFYRIVTSGWLMGALFLLLAAAMGVATFIENDFGVNAARALVYNSWWFELAFFLLSVNMLGNVFNFQLWRLRKFPVLLFHASFFLILAGAAITRYLGYEGMLHIREGESARRMLSSDNYLNVQVTQQTDTLYHAEKTLFSVVSPNNFNFSDRIRSEKITIRSTQFIPSALTELKSQQGGRPGVQLIALTGNNRQDIVVFQGEAKPVGEFMAGFEPAQPSACNFLLERSATELNLTSAFDTYTKIMGAPQVDTLRANTPFALQRGKLYTTGGITFVLAAYFPEATLEARTPKAGEMPGNEDAVLLEIAHKGQLANLWVFGHKDEEGNWYSLLLNDLKIDVRYGANAIQLPFSLKLNQFELERYPGSKSPSSYASEVTLLDERKNYTTDYRIFMNNILHYDGYRFFQSSYDTDEKGTFLSVNRDGWGTGITYWGYILLAIGIVLSLAMPHTRFRQLWSRIGTLQNQQKAGLILLGLTLSATLFASEIKPPHAPDAAFAKRLGEVWVQDHDGRVKPLNTLHNELMRKLVKHNTFKGIPADQVLLSMLTDREYWQQVPLITVQIPEIKQLLGITEKKAAFGQFFQANGQYKIGNQVDVAYRKKPSERDKFDQEIIKIDEQVNIFYLAQQGNFLRLFPHPSDSHTPWMAPTDFVTGISTNDSLFVKSIVPMMLDALQKGNQNDANDYLSAIEGYQKKYGSAILPSAAHGKVEIFYNNLNLYMSLMPWFFFCGALLLLFQFVSLLAQRFPLKWPKRICTTLILIGFAVYTIGLGLRWYIAARAPWSNGYESMIYIGWSTLLAGLLFMRKSPISMSVSALFTAVILMVAHLSWMNPEITNLVPVLKSYWLTIHVAIITASYGFLGLAALLGFINLILIGIRNQSTIKQIDIQVETTTLVAEMAMMAGVYLLTIGSFLGGVWANESWGRYWGWDPKETWSAVTILVYAFIIHSHHIPGFKNRTVLNLLAVLGLSAVIMTYFGVNYYLAGMHSYAKGDSVPVPSFVYYTILTVTVVAARAFYNDFKYRSTEKE